MEPMVSGNVPVNSLSKSNRLLRFGRDAISGGTVPVRLLEDRSSTTRLVRLPISVGTAPSKVLLLPRTRLVSSTIDPMVVGIGPLKLFPVKLRTLN